MPSLQFSFDTLLQLQLQSTTLCRDTFAEKYPGHLRRVWIFTDHVFFLGRTCGNISTCASESDPLDLRRPGVWGRGEAVERQYGHALSSHALHSRPRCGHGLPRWSCARPPRAHFAPGFLRRRKQDSMVGSVLDAHSGFRGKCALVFAAMVSVVLSSG